MRSGGGARGRVRGSFNILAMLSIGVFLISVTLALVVACGTHGRKPDGVITRAGVAS